MRREAAVAGGDHPAALVRGVVAGVRDEFIEDRGG
jgi:hypothetical protein